MIVKSNLVLVLLEPSFELLHYLIVAIQQAFVFPHGQEKLAEWGAIIEPSRVVFWLILIVKERWILIDNPSDFAGGLLPKNFERKECAFIFHLIKIIIFSS